MKIAEATEIVLDLASQQWGMVTTAQAKEAGVPAVTLGRLVDKAVLERVRSGVYISASAGWSSATEIRAQWLALEPGTMAADRLTAPGAVISHESAAELHHIGDLDSPHISFIVPSRRQTRQPEVTFRIAKLDEKDWTVVDGLPVTTAVRTLADLARAGHEPEHLNDMIGDILHRRAATRAEVADALLGIADILTIAPATPQGARAWLEGRFPTPDPSPQTTRMMQEAMAHTLASLPEPSPQQMRAMQESLEKVLAPVQEQLRSLLAAINIDPAVLRSLHQTTDEIADHPALHQAMTDDADSWRALPFPAIDRADGQGSKDNRDEDADE